MVRQLRLQHPARKIRVLPPRREDRRHGPRHAGLAGPDPTAGVHLLGGRTAQALLRALVPDVGRRRRRVHGRGHARGPGHGHRVQAVQGHPGAVQRRAGAGERDDAG